MAWKEPKVSSVTEALKPAKAGERISTCNCYCCLLYHPEVKRWHLFIQPPHSPPCWLEGTPRSISLMYAKESFGLSLAPISFLQSCLSLPGFVLLQRSHMPVKPPADNHIPPHMCQSHRHRGHKSPVPSHALHAPARLWNNSLSLHAFLVAALSLWDSGTHP